MATSNLLDEESIFAAALECESADKRAAFLQVACGGDERLIKRIEALVRSHEGAGTFLNEPAAPAATLDQPARENIGAQIGPYKLRELLGEGGMGCVYVAEQEQPVRRKVALKIIKPGMDSRQVIARFEAERQTLALMDHPNIARVIDAGVVPGDSNTGGPQVPTSGRPYFVMELVRGVPITEFCDQRRLDPRQRLELFIQVCRAIQHAHQKGIIHRDVKPTNILVTLHDDLAVPKVIDFGIAKAMGERLTEQTLYTAFNQMIGTPLYMSPEQAEMNALDVDTRSDVYSLGVLLYELLTGSTPFDSDTLRAAGFDEMRRLIREVDPPRPSQRVSTLNAQAGSTVSRSRGVDERRLHRALRGELDWIVMKALEKDRTRRYETATSLAQDIGRYLCDEPVAACPPSTSYRLRKVVRRYRVPLAVAAGFLLLLVAAAVVSTYQAIRIRSEQRNTLAQKWEADQQRSRAESERDRAVAAEQKAVTEAGKATTISDLLLEMFSSALPDQSKGADYTVRQLLDDSAPRMRDQLKGQPEVDAAISAVIGSVYRRLGLPDKAEPHLQRALAIRRPLAASKSPEALGQLAQSLLDYGWNLRYAQRLPDAERHLREAVELFKKSGAAHGKTLDAMSTLQVILHEQSRYDEASAVANEALTLGGQLFPQGHAELANITHRLAATKHLQRDLPAAEALGRRAVTMHERWHGNDHVETGWSLCHLGNIQTDRQQYAESETNLKRARSIFLAQYGDGHYSMRILMESFTRLYQAKGDAAALAELQADDRARLLKALERDASNLKVRIELGDSFRQSGDVDGALAKYDEVLERRTPETSADVIDRLAEGYVQLGALLRGKQRLDDAARAYRQAIALREPTESASPEVRLKQSLAYNDLAFCLFPMNPAEAEGAVRKGLELKAGLVREFPNKLEYQFHLAHSHNGLSIVLEGTRRRGEAIEELRKAADLLESLAVTDVTTAAPPGLPTWTGHTCWSVGDRASVLGEYARAESLYRRALDIFQRLERAKPNNEYFRLEQGATYRKLADFYSARGRRAEAREHFDLARRVYAALVTQFPDRPFYRQELAFTSGSVAAMLARFGSTDEAVTEYRAALTLHDKAIADFPKESILRDRQMEIRAELAEVLLRTGSYEEAGAVLAEPEFAPSTWQAARRAAAALAGAIEAAQRDAKLSDERRAALVDAWKPQVDRLVAAAVQQCPATSLNDLNHLAWLLVSGDDPLRFDPRVAGTAVELAAKAAALSPDSGDTLNTLGVARYRAGDWKGAIADLEKSIELRKGGDSNDWFFLAMAHEQLGDTDEVRRCYEQGVEWMDKNDPTNKTWTRFRAEAAELLDVSESNEARVFTGPTATQPATPQN